MSMVERKRKKKRESRKYLKRYTYDNGASNLKVRREVKIGNLMNCRKGMEAMEEGLTRQKEK